MADHRGLLGGVERLPFAAGIVSRQTSAENPTGAAGAGCLRDPDPTDPDLPYSGPALELGRGWKVRPYVPLPAGQTIVLADLEGPGVIRHIFLTSNAPSLRSLVLRCTWDDELSPAVDSPLGDFFGVGQDGIDYTLASAVVAAGPSRACSAYWPMPFRRHARVTLTNEGPEDVSIVAYRVAWESTEVSRDAAYFHARWRQTEAGPDRPLHVVLDDVRGRGLYVGTTMTWTTRSPGWWGEGEVKFHLDGDREFPTIVDNGTEDYFGGAWGFGRDFRPPDADGSVRELAFCGPYAGCPLVSEPDHAIRRFSLYRWHIPDPVGFQSDIRVTVQSLGWGHDGRYAIRSDEIASTAFWYQAHDDAVPGP